MVEREILMPQQKLHYEGLFDPKELYKLINMFLRDKWYDMRERDNVKSTTPEGDYIELVLEPWKRLSDYAVSEMIIRVIMENLVDKVVEKDGVKVKLKQGKVTVLFDSFLQTDFENRWSGKPVFFLLKQISDKFIHGDYLTKFKSEAAGDVGHLQELIKSFLNLYRY